MKKLSYTFDENETLELREALRTLRDRRVSLTLVEKGKPLSQEMAYSIAIIVDRINNLLNLLSV